ncbi:glycosyl hydrolase family 65 protein [Bremerella sp.]|uniref:glycosyl hydrolase family 65 protein n=1 Tax=Bremerella sp. TaxID=2795602 RepID=UPI00391A514C
MFRYGTPAWLLLLLVSISQAQTPLPTFEVPGQQQMTSRLEALFQRHHSPQTRCTLWDAWIPMSTLWPAVGDDLSAEPMRRFYRHVYLNRQIDPSGYVVMDQHRGHAHPGGWPFPLWEQAGGAGWHFTIDRDPYRKMMNMRPTDVKSLAIQGATNLRQDNRFGLRLTTQGPQTSITLPVRALDSFVAPFIVMEWSSDQLPQDSTVTLSWRRVGEKQFTPACSTNVAKDSGVGGQYGAGLKLSVVPVHEHPEWRGKIEQLRVEWTNHAATDITIRNIHTATDSRHPITNALFVRGSTDTFLWTHDVSFLKQNIQRMRTAIEYSLDEFSVRQEGAMLVQWPGHDGRAGFIHDAQGNKTLRHGHGVGNNYWDLLPFGHYDCYASMVEYDALLAMATIEAAIAAHPEWEIALPKLDHAALTSLAGDLKQRAGKRFWDETNGRFVACIDADGKSHDYGFTFLNLEAIYYGFATPQQAEQILQWLDGEREIAGDTSTGADIYHWRFAPRATTRRNLEWYAWVWHNPDHNPWGGQVQDGGAVLGFSYHDLMARLAVNGPDDAARRLKEITDWFAEVEDAGGYRKYYAVPGRGSLQGGGTPGGLGLDHEFMESVLVPQVMLYGFLGFQPTADGFSLQPKLPHDWPSLQVTRIAWADHVFDLKASQAEIQLTFQKAGQTPVRINLPEGSWQLDQGDAKLVSQVLTVNPSDQNHTIRLSQIQ